MPVILLHGEDQVLALRKIADIKKDFTELEINTFNLKQTSISQIVTEISGSGLFSTHRLFIVENIDDKADLSLLNIDPESTVILKIAKQLTQNSALIKQAKTLGFQIFEFSEPKDNRIFTFLDYLAEQNMKSLAMFEQLYGEYGGQYLLTMIFFQFRKLINPGNAPSFVMNKIQSQQKKFNISKISQVYKLSLNLDYQIKRGLIDDKTGLTLLVQKIITL